MQFRGIALIASGALLVTLSSSETSHAGVQPPADAASDPAGDESDESDEGDESGASVEVGADAPGPAAAPADDRNWAILIGSQATINLTSGERATGVITEDAGDLIVVRTNAGVKFIPKADVVSVTPPESTVNVGGTTPGSEPRKPTTPEERARYELRQGQLAGQYKTARGLTTGGIVLTPVSGLSILIGAAILTPNDINNREAIGGAVLGTGIVMLGGGVAMMTIGLLRKKKLKAKAWELVQPAPMSLRGGGGLQVRMSF